MVETMDSWLQDYFVAVYKSIETQSSEPIIMFYLLESQEYWGKLLNASWVISLP